MSLNYKIKKYTFLVFFNEQEYFKVEIPALSVSHAEQSIKSFYNRIFKTLYPSKRDELKIKRVNHESSTTSCAVRS